MEITYSIFSSYGRGNEDALINIRDIGSIDLTDCEKITFSFNQFRENTPFNVLTIASFLKRYRAQHNDCEFYLLPKESDDYLSHLGFYQMIGAKIGKEVGEAQVSNTHVPIKEIKLNYDFYETIETRAKELAALLHFDKALEEFVSYLFVETIRNVYEHSGASSAFICAQKWPTKKLVEIAIVDEGVGVANALRKRFPDKEEKELLYLSLQPGISARSNFMYLERESPWRNSGYGLFMMHKLAVAYGGTLLLCSGNYALWVKSDGIHEYMTSFSGTALAITFKTDTNNKFDIIRNSILVEGQDEAFYNPEAIRKASRSSGGHYNDK